MRMMGAESVAYHRDTIIGRGDDHPGAGACLLRLPGRDPPRLGRLGRRFPRPVRCG